MTDTPIYVNGKYTVAQRDVLFDRINAYPDASAGSAGQSLYNLGNGQAIWRDPTDGPGTESEANANIAPIEATGFAARAYNVGDTLIYSGQLFRVTAPIAVNDALTVGANITPTTVAAQDKRILTALDVAIITRTPIEGKGINLLDNWDFVNPINQRGQTSYTGVGYTIDRWRSASGTVTLDADGIIVDSSEAYFQLLEMPERRSGETFTLSALVKCITPDANARFGFVRNDDWGSYAALPQAVGETALVTVTDTMPSGLTMMSAWWYIPTGKYKIIVSKLEGGTEQTLVHNEGTEENPVWVLNDQPPNLQQELAKCQRYQVVSGATNGAFGRTEGSGTNLVTVNIPVRKMRIPPALVGATSFVLVANGTAQSVVLPSGTTASDIETGANFQISVSSDAFSSLGGAFQPVSVYISSGYILDANP